MSVFPASRNPAKSLYRFWDQFVPEPDTRYQGRLSCTWSRWGPVGSQGRVPDIADNRRGWGGRNWQIGRIYSPDEETALIYGTRYTRIDTKFILLPDGRFSIRYVHGYNSRMSLSRSTFLHYDSVAGRERWSVRPDLSWKWLNDDALDRQGHVPKLLVQKFGFDLLWELKRDPANTRADNPESKGWQIVLAEDQSTSFKDPMAPGDLRWVKEWLALEDRRRLRRIDLRANPRPKRERREPVEPDIPAIASHIVALLEVDKPANNVPHPKVRRLQEAS